MKRINLFLPEVYIIKLRGLSNETGLSVAEIIRRAVDDYLKKLDKEKL